MSTKVGAKTADYYLSLNYPVTVQKLTEEEGGGYAAFIPQLGSGTFVAVGETDKGALDSLSELKEYLIPRMLERGVRLPEPEQESTEQASGSLMLRVPPVLHARLTFVAKRNKCSLNKLSTQLLSEGLEREAALDEFRSAVREAVTEEIQNGLSQIRDEICRSYFEVTAQAQKASVWSSEPTLSETPGDFRVPTKPKNQN